MGDGLGDVEVLFTCCFFNPASLDSPGLELISGSPAIPPGVFLDSSICLLIISSQSIFKAAFLASQSISAILLIGLLVSQSSDFSIYSYLSLSIWPVTTLNRATSRI